MFHVQAPKRLGKNFTGRFMTVDFTNGTAEISKNYLRKLLLRYGCTDLTTPEQYQEMIDRPINRALFIRYGAFGDNLIVTTAIKAFKQKHPDAVVHVISKPPSSEVFVNNPHVDALLVCRPLDIGYVTEDYDEVYDLTHSIEHNPMADWKDANEIACEWVDAVPRDSDYKPVFKPTENEKVIAAGILADHGVDSDKDDIIVFHSDSTSAMRSLPDPTAAEVMVSLASKGYKVVLPGFRDFSSVIANQDPYIRNNIISLRLEVLHDVISARAIMTTALFAKLIIAIDSAYSHLAAALDIPSLLIYGPFDPATRAKHYDKARILYRPMDCGPCQTLGRFCPRYPCSDSPCMQQYTADEIILMADKILIDNLDPEPLDTIDIDTKDIRPCTICGFEHASAYTRKGNYFYLRCQRCNSIYTHKPAYINISNECMPGDNYIEHYAAIMQQVANAHNITGRNFHLDAPDKILSGMKYYLSKNGWNFTDMDVNLAGLFYSLEISSDPIMKFNMVANKLVNGGIMVVYGPLADRCQSNAWPPLNPPVCGMNETLPSKDAYRYLAQKANMKILKIDVIGDNILMVIQKEADQDEPLLR